MQKEFTTTSSKQTQNLGRMLARELRGGPASTRGNDRSSTRGGPASTRGNDRSSTRGGEVICLEGELGAGKTTFTQGFLEELSAEKPYTSPTFVIMKEYELRNPKSKIRKVYHIDAYRVEKDDVLALGWEEIVADPKNIVIIEWASRVKDIIPPGALWVDFEWKGEEERRIIFKNSPNF